MSNNKHGQITTALVLAAGTGSRLYPLTQNMPKCLTMVNDIPIIKRLVSCLKRQGFKRLVIVTGYLENCIREFLGTHAGSMQIEYIYSPLYATTNNIYSLWMARDVINEPFLLIESDLVFDESLIGDMLYPDRIAVATMQQWMNGTSVTIKSNHSKFQQVKAFLEDNVNSFGEIKYKTVNIYSFSLASWHRIVKKLDKHISDGKVNDYYEVIFAEMIADGSLSFEIVSFDDKPWYEIDTVEDLVKAERLFLTANHKTTRKNSLLQADSMGTQFVKTVKTFH